MRKIIEFMPTLMLSCFTGLVVWNGHIESVYALIAAAILWAHWFYITIPKPDCTPRLDELDQQVADLVDSRDEMTKSIDALKTAVGMRQLR